MLPPKIKTFPDPIFTHVRGTSPPLFKIYDDVVITLVTGEKIVIPQGFLTDFASTPRLLWSWLPPDEYLLEGSIPHDFYYPHRYFLTFYIAGQTYSDQQLAIRKRFPAALQRFVPIYIGEDQSFADEFLKEAVIKTENAPITAEEALIGLKAGGWEVWDKYRKQGPNAYKQNVLGLPGLGEKNEILL